MTCKYWVYYNISDEDKFHIIDFFFSLSTCEITWHYKNSEVMWYISCLGIHVLCLWISCFDLSKNICIEHIIHLIFKSFKYIYFFLFLIWNIISFIYRKKYQGYKQVKIKICLAWISRKKLKSVLKFLLRFKEISRLRFF